MFNEPKLKTFFESDWIKIAQNCCKLERLAIGSAITGLTPKSLTVLHEQCENLKHFEFRHNDSSVCNHVVDIFNESIETMEYENVCDADIGYLARKCPNLTHLCLAGCMTSWFWEGVKQFPNLRKLELLSQRHVYSNDLLAIGLHCANLEEFHYTNEFCGKHTVSHDLLVMVYHETFPKLKKFYTNDDTCSKRMILLIQQNKPDIQVFDSWYQCIG